ncbi:MAG: BolA family protein [Gammaproteobacteria bacterium]
MTDMPNPARQLVADKLRALSPLHLEVHDDSALHIGHREAAAGAHLRVVVVAAVFDAMPKIARHRLVQKTIGDYAAARIHAVQIAAIAPGE